MAKTKLKSLGKSGSAFFGLETFKAPKNSFIVKCVSDEVTALCPVTGQPDWYVVSISYQPSDRCVESKSLKLYLHRFRNKGHFCEAFADIIAKDLDAVLEPQCIEVTVKQKSRGGISIEASSRINRGF